MTKNWIVDIDGNKINYSWRPWGEKQERMFPKNQDGMPFIGCCGGYLYNHPITKDVKVMCSGITVATRRVVNRKTEGVDKTIVNTSNGQITIWKLTTRKAVTIG